MKERPVPEQAAPSWFARAATWCGETLDQAIYACAPSAGARRIQFRRNFAQLSAARDERINLSTFEGAQNDTTRGESWIGSRLSTDSALEKDRDSLVSRSRELARNDSFGGAIDGNVNQVVGTGFTAQAKIGEAFAGTEAAKIFREELEAIYKRWSPKSDISRKVSLWQQTRLLQRHIKMDGEGLAVLSDDYSPEAVIPLAIEIIDPERLETPPQLAGNKLVRMGVEKDPAGRIVAYWIRKSHPGDTLDVDQNYDRVPAERVLHVFERWFAGQTRGLPWLCRALNRIKDAKDLDEAELLRAQIQACFAAFVEPPEAGYGQSTPQTAATGTANGVRYEDIRPGAIHYGLGGKVTFGTPNGGDFGPLQEHNLRRIAAALNIPYEVFAKNWSGMSFAGGRIVLTDLRLDVESQQQLLMEQFLTPVWNRLVFEAVLTGRCSIEPRFYFARPWLYEEHQWTPPEWSYAITPGEYFKAKLAMVDAGAMTMEDLIGEMGDDFERVQKQRGREIKMQEAEGVRQSPMKAAGAPPGGSRVAA